MQRRFITIKDKLINLDTVEDTCLYNNTGKEEWCLDVTTKADIYHFSYDREKDAQAQRDDIHRMLVRGPKIYTYCIGTTQIVVDLDEVYCVHALNSITIKIFFKKKPEAEEYFFNTSKLKDEFLEDITKALKIRNGQL